MKYKVCKYSKEKLINMFNNQGFKTVEECKQRIGWWLEAKKSDISTQLVIIDVEEDKIIEI